MHVFKIDLPKDLRLGKHRFVCCSNDKSIVLNVWGKEVGKLDRIEKGSSTYIGCKLCAEDMSPEYKEYHTSNAGAVYQFLGPELYQELKVMLGEQSGLSGTKAQ